MGALDAAANSGRRRERLHGVASSSGAVRDARNHVPVHGSIYAVYLLAALSRDSNAGECLDAIANAAGARACGLGGDILDRCDVEDALVQRLDHHSPVNGRDRGCPDCVWALACGNRVVTCRVGSCWHSGARRMGNLVKQDPAARCGSGRRSHGCSHSARHHARGDARRLPVRPEWLSEHLRIECIHALCIGAPRVPRVARPTTAGSGIGAVSMKPIRVVCALALIPVLALMSVHGLPAASSEDHKDVSQSIVIARSGTQPSMRGDAHNFTGAVRIDPLLLPKASSRVSAAYVTFEPGARTAWHTHPVGQTFIITAGTGLVQRWADEVQEIHPGDV